MPVPLTPKLFDLLVILISNAGRLVDKNTLLQGVWPDVAVEEGNLTKGIFSLRQILEQDSDDAYIETVPKRGYRFTKAVTTEEQVKSVAQAEDAPSAPFPNSIAVLSFSDMTSARDQDFFCEGMSEELISALGRVPDLRVASYTSSCRFKGKSMDVREIGRELMVAWILEGSIRKSKDTVRISVKLVRASDGFSAWTGRFDRQVDDIFAVQDEIAGMVTQTLAHRVRDEVSPLVSSTTANSTAYSLYLEGRYLWNKRPGDVVWQALERFEQAISVDPNFAPAHAALANVYGTLGAWEFGVLPPAEALAKAKAAANRALALDPLLPAGRTAIGYTTLHFDWNPEKAVDAFDQAIALNPAWVDAHHWLSHALCAAGQFSRSLHACRQTLEFDPLNPLMHAHLAWHYYMAKGFAEALTQAERVIRMEPSFHWGHYFAGWALERLGRLDQAIPALHEAVRCSANNPVMLSGLGYVSAAAHERSDALRIVEELRRLRGRKGLFAYEIGIIHAALSDRDAAFKWFARAVDERSGWIAYLKVDPRLEHLHADPRFERLAIDVSHSAHTESSKKN